MKFIRSASHDSDMDRSRSRVVKQGRMGNGPVIYWMSRDQRCQDNPALALAQERAKELKRPLSVMFLLSPSFRGATVRQYGFMLRALKGVEKDLAALDISFRLISGGTKDLSLHLDGSDPALMVEDFDPLSTKRQWKDEVRASTRCDHYEVDAHNIVPCWLASSKQEWAARTFRPKLARSMDQYLTDQISPEHHPHPGEEGVGWTVKEALDSLDVEWSVKETDVEPGRKAGERTMMEFIKHRLEHYSEDRNDPNLNGQSGLSPYLHFGTISPQRVAWEVQRSDVTSESKESFLEELIVRRELSDNYCYYNPSHDRFEGLPPWSRLSLEKHAKDERPHVYSLEELAAGETEDDLWNAMQKDMVARGKMHGYLRMYWAKKVLEWSPHPRDAIERLIWLNDRYELDGRDPNGHVGILWSVGGLHDRPWKERKIFGTVRYMSKAGLSRKFDTTAFGRRNLERLG